MLFLLYVYLYIHKLILCLNTFVIKPMGFAKSTFGNRFHEQLVTFKVSFRVPSLNMVENPLKVGRGTELGKPTQFLGAKKCC